MIIAMRVAYTVILQWLCWLSDIHDGHILQMERGKWRLNSSIKRS